ncbi:MAG TPA: YicC family protein [Bacteroidales bacterium]|nr:YicC family protein [Bacteroidales bacterium]HPS51491.1 YicC family protein [Bacteroidales bacterium]
MIKSMTGYGKAAVEIAGKKLTVEIKTLNSKQLDTGLKLPGCLRDQEPELRNMISRKLERGKVDLLITADAGSDLNSVGIDLPLAKKYYAELSSLSGELRIDRPPDILSLVMKMPDVLQTRRDEITPEQIDSFLQAVSEALEITDQFRISEGRILEEDMLKRVHTILQFLDRIEPFEKGRMEEMRNKLMVDFRNLSRDLNSPAPDQNRFEQELIYYLEKLDITEEKVRLLKHCQFFLECLSEDQSQGKKLGFITQEMGREINTIGSKANHAGIQKIVVQMKDELEKIKEQLGNIL